MPSLVHTYSKNYELFLYNSCVTMYPVFHMATLVRKGYIAASDDHVMCRYLLLVFSNVLCCYNLLISKSYISYLGNGSTGIHFAILYSFLYVEIIP